MNEHYLKVGKLPAGLLLPAFWCGSLSLDILPSVSSGQLGDGGSWEAGCAVRSHVGGTWLHGVLSSQAGKGIVLEVSRDNETRVDLPNRNSADGHIYFKCLSFQREVKFYGYESCSLWLQDDEKYSIPLM